MDRQLASISPVDGRVYVSRAYAKEHEAEQALSLAAKAQKAWSKTSVAERVALCEKMLAAFSGQKEQMVKELCWMMGRPVRYGAGEIRGVEQRARYMMSIAGQALAPVCLDDEQGMQRFIKRQPLGVVFVIAPWNYPYLTAVNSIVPAILAGNSVILKHSAQTPLCAEHFHRAFAQAGLPDGVFQYLHLTHTDTQKLLRQGNIHQVCFTGSVGGGHMVEQALAGRFIGASLELGGKDPAYVRPDADLDVAVATAVDGAYFNSGQSCCAIERIYVHEDIYDAFVGQAVALVKQYRLGRPDDAGTTIGPMVRGEAADFVRGQISRALEQGAVAHIHPEDGLDPLGLDKPGSPYLTPQLLTEVDHTMSLMKEESFGPVVGIQKVGSDEQALGLMNDSEFGLTAAIFTRDLARGIRLGEQIETGTFFINRCDYLDPALAWTGVKHSGRGCSLSRLGFDALTRPKSFLINPGEDGCF
ncbi:aldehyde dehydrogenase family protein [Thalassomonas viridans]|uniref:Aldehyde dehydrogenase family protein n=1 Tax=Thalassomonas viridans TaxID=137584 RepID=A0AAE9Z477_9GAMM|nr:aldehyde dehydrogenase family protein [Thalassomonas viridans]WDE05765.1 aldehyde dehydrogenase family protein [Thalassomonas viridans]